LEWSRLEREIMTLKIALNANDVQLVSHLLQKLVTDYQPSEDIVDWVFLEQGQAEATY